MFRCAIMYNSWISHFLACFGSCIDCCSNSQSYLIDDPSKGFYDFWSTSTCDLENCAMLSQRSLSSIILSNHGFNQVNGVGSSNNDSEFVNHGLLVWNQSRLLWVGTNKSKSEQKVQDSVLSWNETYESLLGTSKPFRCPVPLSELVEFLVDIWDQEGLYDEAHP